MDLELRKQKYLGKGFNGVCIKEERANFLFLSNGTMVYDYDKFNSIEDALVDAVVNGGEDLDEMISMIYFQTNSYLKPTLLEKIDKLRNNQ